MKKIAMTALALMLASALLLFAGCNRQAGEDIELGSVATPAPTAITDTVEPPAETAQSDGNEIMTPLDEAASVPTTTPEISGGASAQPEQPEQTEQTQTPEPHITPDASIDWDEISGLYLCTIEDGYEKNGGFYLKINEINYAYEEYPAVNHLGMSYMDAKLVVYDEIKAQFTVVMDGDTTIFYVDPANPMADGGDGNLTLETFKNNYLGKTYSGDGRPYIFEVRLYDGFVDSIGLWNEYYMSIYTDLYNTSGSAGSVVNNGGVLLPGSDAAVIPTPELGGTDLFQNP